MNKITLVFEMSYKQLSRGVALCVLTCCLAWSTAAAAQEVAVTGTVLLASDSTAVPGASVRLRDSKGATLTGLATKDDGTFAIKAEGQKVADLYITFVGTQPVTIGIKGAGQTKDRPWTHLPAPRRQDTR